MIIYLLKDGEQIAYENKPCKFKTLYKIAELERKVKEREKLIKNSTDEEIMEKLGNIDNLKEIRENVSLVCEYFNDQFTVDEFMSGYHLESFDEFNTLLYIIMFEAQHGNLGSVTDTDEKK